jgi:hypothetical protein
MLLPVHQCDIIDTWTVGGLRGTQPRCCGGRRVCARDVRIGLFRPLRAAGAAIPHAGVLPRYPRARCNDVVGSPAPTLKEMAGAKTPARTTQMLRDTSDAQARVSQAEALVRSARLFLYDSVDQLWTKLLTSGEVTMEARARLAAPHAVSSAVQAVNLMCVAGGVHELLAGPGVPRCAAYRCPPAGHALDGPGALRSRLGHPAALSGTRLSRRCGSVSGPSPEPAATRRMRRLRTLPPSPRNGEIRPKAVVRWGC